MKVFKVSIDERLGETILVAAEDYGGAERVTKKVKGGFVRIAGMDCLGKVEMEKESEEHVKTMLEYDAQDEDLEGYLNPGDRVDKELFLLIGEEEGVKGLPTYITQGGRPRDFGDGTRMRMTAVYLGNEVYRYVGYMPEFGTGKEEPKTRTFLDFEAQDKDADEWLEVGDLVEEKLFMHLAEAVSPSYMKDGVTQCGDPVYDIDGVLCYMTFRQVDKRGEVYLGVLPEFKIGEDMP